VVSILNAQRRILLHQSSRFKINMSQIFFKDLEPWRRRHQTKRDWRGAKGGERNTFKNLDKKCKQGKCSH